MAKKRKRGPNHNGGGKSGNKKKENNKAKSNQEEDDSNQDVPLQQRLLATNYAVHLAKRDEICRKKICERASKKRMEEKKKLDIKKDNMEVAAAATTITEMKTATLKNAGAKNVNHGTPCDQLDHILFDKKPAAKIAMTDQEKKIKQEIVTPAYCG